MTDREDRRRHTRCSFCGKGQEQVRKLVAGPGVYICDQCIDLCQEVLEEDNRSTSSKRVKSGMMPTPQVIMASLDQHVIGQSVDFFNDPAEADDFRPCAKHSGNFHRNNSPSVASASSKRKRFSFNRAHNSL